MARRAGRRQPQAIGHEASAAETSSYLLHQSLAWIRVHPAQEVRLLAFFVTARYRLPMQIALLAPAGAAVAWMIDRVRARAWDRLAPVAGVTAALALFVGWPTGLELTAGRKHRCGSRSTTFAAAARRRAKRG